MTGSGIKAGMVGDIVSEVMKNMGNWTNQGNPSMSFADGVNTVGFTNTGDMTIEQGLKAKALELYNYNLTQASTIVANWNGYASRKMVSFNYPDYHTLRYVFCDTYTIVNDHTITVSGSWMQNNINTNSGAISGNSGTNTYTIDTAQGIFEYGNKATYEASLVGFNGYSQATFSVNAGATYAIAFDTKCNVTLDSNYSNHVQIVNGNNTINYNLDTSNHSKYIRNIILFTANTNTITLKFDYSKMVNTNPITLSVKDIALHELVSVF